MSHQTGIQANTDLVQFISKCRQDNKIRLLKVTIQNEELILGEVKEAQNEWGADYEAFVSGVIVERQPCYILFRLDSVNSSGVYEWVLITWSPEDSPVREKMLYASTKATLKLSFGSASIVIDYFATNKTEINLTSYMQYLNFKKAQDEDGHDLNLLTLKEQDLREVKRNEALSSSISKSVRKTIPGIEFPITEDAMEALFDFKGGQLSYVQLSIDLKMEEIILETKLNSEQFNIDNLKSIIPQNQARYHLILYAHTYETVLVKSVIFIYSIAGNNCSVKERMLYSSCKGALLNAIQDEDKIGIQVTKRIECDDPNELTEEFFLNELHPKEDIIKSKFAKPKGPPGRGKKRMTKPKE